MRLCLAGTFPAEKIVKEYRPEYVLESFFYIRPCPVCGWVNDGVQRADPDYRGGYNRISLNEAKKKFAAGKKVFD